MWPVWALVTTLMAGWILAVRWKGLYADVWVSHPVVSPGQYLEQLSMTQMWGATSIVGPSYVMPGWSISAEWAAYLAFPLLAVLLLPLRRLPAGVLLGLATLLMTPMAVTAFVEGPLDPEVPWLYRLACSFVAGMLVAIGTLGLRRTPRVEQLAFAVSVACTVAFVVFCFWASWRRAGDPAHDYAGISVVLFPALVGAFALTDRGPAAWLSRDLVVYGGRISYCLYLVHYPVFDVLLTYVWQGQDPTTRVVGPGLALLAPFAVVLSVLLAMALHHGVEVPARSLLLRGRARAVARLVRRRPAVEVPSGTEVIPVPRGAAVHGAAAGGPRTRALPAVPFRPSARETVGPRS
ncbi:acyltransferase [Blastococcus sp. TML/M2B]|uniref:acyltransferase family protein n=1 Tax=Blastococcus sp. TML/M2B TaxID=2798727 RepID=UPI00190A8AC4|nr:acyltransferase [Blastococcus sp. TML/M2B]MBN1093841.1 acyltransferase [Blastococcus sp. TML/M2B]